MFKSLNYLRYDSKANSYIYLLIDSEFECEVAAVASGLDWLAFSMASTGVVITAAVTLEYDKRNFPVGRNLLLISKCFSENYDDLNQILSCQNEFIPKYLKEINYHDHEIKWEQWKKERDEYLIMM
jgi:hypothetical protein